MPVDALDPTMLLRSLLTPSLLNSLTSLQMTVFTKCWEGKTYFEIAEELGYDSGYIRDVGAKLWRTFSDFLNTKVTKNNLRSILSSKAHEVEFDERSIAEVGSSLKQGYDLENLVNRLPMHKTELVHKTELTLLLSRIQADQIKLVGLLGMLSKLENAVE